MKLSSHLRVVHPVAGVKLVKVIGMQPISVKTLEYEPEDMNHHPTPSKMSSKNLKVSSYIPYSARVEITNETHVTLIEN